MKRFLPRPTYANVVATLALFVALGGASYAAVAIPANSVGTKQLKDGAVTSAKVASHSLTGADIKASTLGTVPNADQAASADTASHATSADTAGHAASADSAHNRAKRHCSRRLCTGLLPRQLPKRNPATNGRPLRSESTRKPRDLPRSDHVLQRARPAGADAN